MKKTLQLCTLFLLTLAAVGSPALGQGYEAVEPTVDSALDEGSYTYLRIVEGSATLTQGDTGDREDARLHQPVLVGDRLWVSPGSRLELVLSDRNRLRLDEGTEVVFETLAASPDASHEETALRLLEGNLQLVVTSEWQGSDPPRVELPGSTVFTREAGSYRAQCDPYGDCRVVVREGSAEVLTDRGSLLVRAGEAAVLERRGDLPQVSLVTAEPWDDLERWGERLEIEARRADVRGVDDSLRYAAAPLDEYGDWVDSDDGWAWRPRASSDWRPYWRGSWRYTPSGMFWISDEPWGWVTHHYGAWDLHPHYGWIWYPSNTFAPAWVYWYWGPRHVAWVPAGYYTRHYRPHHSGFSFHFGVYGYAGGSYHHYRDWVFCDLSYFRRHHHRRDFHHHIRRGHDLERVHRGDVVPRGIITTDTRGLSPQRLDDPQRRLRELADRRDGTRRAFGRSPDRGDALPDVTPFVARQPELPEPVRRRVTTTRRPDRPLRNPSATSTEDAPRPTRVTVRPRRPDTPDARPSRIDRPDTSDRRPLRDARPETRTTAPRAEPRQRTVRPRTVEPWARGDDRPLRRPTTSARPDRPTTGSRTRGPTGSDRPSAAERPLRRPTRPSAADSPRRRPTTSDRPLRTERPATSSRAPARRPTTSSRTPTRRPTTSSSRPSTRPSASGSSKSPRSSRPSVRPSRSPRSKPSARSSSGRSSRGSAEGRSGGGSRSRGKARPRRNGS